MIELEPVTSNAPPDPESPSQKHRQTSSGIGRLLPRTVRGSLILLIFVVIFPRELTEVSHYYSLFQEQREQEYKNNLQIARAIGTTFDAFVQDLLVDEVALGRTLNSWGSDSTEHLNALLDINMNEYAALRGYHWLDPEGRILLSSDASLVGKYYPNRHQILEIESGNDWLISNIFQRSEDNEISFLVATGFRDEKENLLGTLIAEVDPARIGETLRYETPGHAAFIIIDAAGRSVYRYPPVSTGWEQRLLTQTQPIINDALAGHEVSGTINALNGQKRMASYAPIKSVGWVASASREEDEVLAPIFQELVRESALDILVLALTILAALATSYYISGPLQRLRRQTIAFGTGRIREKRDNKGPEEIRDLTDAFNTMADEVELRERQSIKAREELYRVLDELEKRVLDRTAELAKANEDLREEIAERRRMEEQLRRAQRLETAGRIAGQVAHDFNNLLSPLVGYPDLIRMYLPDDHPAIKFCDAMLVSAQQMADINQDLLTLSRRGHFALEPTNLNAIIEQAVANGPPQPDTLGLELRLSEDLLPVAASAAQLMRVITNLLANAREAMLDTGVLTIETENIYIDKPFGRFNRVDIGEYVRMRVVDTGCGIPPEIMDKVFDPFFTTKRADRQRGSGLGLSVVQVIVDDLKGYIDLETEIGKGTKFDVYLPVSRGNLPNLPQEEAPRGTETVLIVDDDPAQREVVRLLLQSLGYEVTTVASGEEALDYLREHYVDLLILDMIMPGGIDGTETFNQAIIARADQKALILSGFAESDRVQQAQELGAGNFIRKPITLTKLAQAVRQELDRVK